MTIANISRKFLDAINDVSFENYNQGAYIELQLNPFECADGGWLFRSRESNDSSEESVFALFVDCKSAQEQEQEQEEEEGNVVAAVPDAWAPKVMCTGRKEFHAGLLPGKGEQAKRLLNMASAVRDGRDRDQDRDIIQKGSLADALAQGNFLYVYLNTGREASFGVDGHILHMGRKDTEWFLSIFKELYSVYRHSSKEGDKKGARD